MGYSPWDCQESDTTEPMSAHTLTRAHTHTHTRRHSFKPKVPEIDRKSMKEKKREPAWYQHWWVIASPSQVEGARSRVTAVTTWSCLGREIPKA